MTADVDRYYGYILIIFFSANACNFMVLWIWLRRHVTERLCQLQNSIKTNEKNESRKFEITQSEPFENSAPEYTKRNSLDTANKGSIFQSKRSKW